MLSEMPPSLPAAAQPGTRLVRCCWLELLHALRASAQLLPLPSPPPNQTACGATYVPVAAGLPLPDVTPHCLTAAICSQPVLLMPCFSCPPLLCRWNYLWALGYNCLMIPVAAGVLYPVMRKQVG